MLHHPLVAKSEPEPFRFNVEDWHRLGEAGIFHEDDRVELLDGEIIIMSPIGNRHTWALTNLNELFSEQNRRRYFVWTGNPVEADRRSEPLPDIALIPRSLKGSRQHPLTNQVHLIVEISDSSLTYDRGRKLHKYASSGTPEYWIVNLQDDVIEVHRQPVSDTFAQITTHSGGDTITPLAFPDVSIPVAEIIPLR
jgi:Uma2 family endonuclease